jgi:phosphatidylethanolamine/phosphatidyl-N-methylethanolamine N-methyltransferase
MNNDNDFNLEYWYKNNYNEINATAVPDSVSNKILHRLIEKPFKSNEGMNILEVGANKGEHAPFVAENYLSYLMTDIRMVASPTTIASGNNAEKVSFQVADVHSLPFEDNRFDRVISTCLFHHLDHPMDALREVRRVTKVNGTVSILIPNDPGILYRTLRGLTTLRTARKKGLLQDAQFFHALEHRNHYLQLQTLIDYAFRDDGITKSYFPLKIKSYNLNALTAVHVEKLTS